MKVESTEKVQMMVDRRRVSVEESGYIVGMLSRESELKKQQPAGKDGQSFVLMNSSVPSRFLSSRCCENVIYLRSCEMNCNLRRT